MKKVIFILVSLVLFSGIAFAELKNEAQKFKVVYKITYNAIPLDQAREIEKKIQKQFSDACSLKITVDTVDEGEILFNLTSVN